MALPTWGSEYQVRIQTIFQTNPKIYGSFKPAKAMVTIRERRYPVRVAGRLVLNKQKLFVLQEMSDGRVAATGLKFERRPSKRPSQAAHDRIQAQGQERALAQIYLPYIKKAMNAGGPKAWRKLPNEITMQDVLCSYQGKKMVCQAKAVVRLGTPGEAKIAQQRPLLPKSKKAPRRS
ncbi:MAG: hypothetical protein J6Y94_09340 [Bacteriovoracaceae bacterium]|nr:hypothetical protein [Bacteriovoracaceae bacterium]